MVVIIGAVGGEKIAKRCLVFFFHYHLKLFAQQQGKLTNKWQKTLIKMDEAKSNASWQKQWKRRKQKRLAEHLARAVLGVATLAKHPVTSGPIMVNRFKDASFNQARRRSFEWWSHLHHIRCWWRDTVSDNCATMGSIYEATTIRMLARWTGTAENLTFHF